MAGKGVSIDELLADQERSSITATVERSSRGDEYVRVTPFLGGDQGCACNFTLDVQRSALGGLKRTGETHVCCGKRLAVVEIDFSDDTTRDLLAQVVVAATRNAGASLHPTDTARASSAWPLAVQTAFAPRPNCEEQWLRCLGDDPDDFTRCICANGYRRCMHPNAPMVPCPPPGP